MNNLTCDLEFGSSLIVPNEQPDHVCVEQDG